MNGCTCWFRCSVEALANCRCQVLVGDRKGSLKSYWQVCRLASVRSTLISALVLFARAWVCPLIHFRNVCTCWSRCSLEAISDYR